MTRKPNGPAEARPLVDEETEHFLSTSFHRKKQPTISSPAAPAATAALSFLRCDQCKTIS
jgi:hypothetical protein